MGSAWKRTVTATAALALLAGICGPQAEARDFLSELFGGFAMPSAPPPLPSFVPGFGGPHEDGPPAPRATGPAMAYCVRTCDGRYFPLANTGGQSRAATCKSFCPASETRVFVGSGIDNASAMDNGKSYASMPNAFRYRTELVSGCTCNGKDPGGLAHIDIENDPTLRKGDLVATSSGALIKAGTAQRSASSAPVHARAPHARFSRVPVMAAE
ncbi:MAG: DUF2865 domain-containing protein [Rhizobiales bacterium]|nr:DUF2865 domain-containing protein [Hyphomicrobiales bacterium]